MKNTTKKSLSAIGISIGVAAMLLGASNLLDIYEMDKTPKVDNTPKVEIITPDADEFINNL